jgi:hypothetical protein
MLIEILSAEKGVAVRVVWVRYLTILGWIAVAGSKDLPAQEVRLPGPLEGSLARFAELKTLSVTWTEQIDRAGSSKKWEPASLYLVWQNGKVYSRQSAGTLRTESAFNGENIYVGRPKRTPGPGEKRSATPANAGLVISRAKDRDPDKGLVGGGSLDVLGIRIPHTTKELLGTKSLESQVLFFLTHGNVKTLGPADLDGRPMTRISISAENPAWRVANNSDPDVLEKALRKNGRKGREAEERIKKSLAESRRRKELTPRRLEYVFYLDPELGYALRRSQERTEDGKLRIQCDCTDHEKLPGHEIWLPRTCRREIYVKPSGELVDAPVVTVLIRVSHFGTDPVPEEQFTLNYTSPGTLVSDNRKGVTYRVPDYRVLWIALIAAGAIAVCVVLRKWRKARK